MSKDPSLISEEAKQLVHEVNVIDLHVDGMIPHRLFGYDLNKRHEGSWSAGCFFGHLDFPRARENGLSAAMWSITTNPLRGGKGRWKALKTNLESLQAQVAGAADRVVIATTAAEYREALSKGQHVVLPSIQGGNALSQAPNGVASLPVGLLSRVTLVHLTNSEFGVTSSPFALGRRGEGLTKAGKDFVEDLNANRVFVDLAHINKPGFWDAVSVHDNSKPLLVTHTGVEGICPHWRNLDDEQIRAVADTGGVVGVIFHMGFLTRRGGPRDCEMVLEHMEHIIKVVGEDFVSLGSDYDGLIIPPAGLRHEPAYGLLVQRMLERNWTSGRIEKVLGGNFLRCFEALRGA